MRIQISYQTTKVTWIKRFFSQAVIFYKRLRQILKTINRSESSNRMKMKVLVSILESQQVHQTQLWEELAHRTFLSQTKTSLDPKSSLTFLVTPFIPSQESKLLANSRLLQLQRVDNRQCQIPKWIENLKKQFLWCQNSLFGLLFKSAKWWKDLKPGTLTQT